MKSLPTILCFVQYYLPGYRSGGPVRSISNFVDSIGDRFNIKIITSDHDSFENKSYENIKINQWNYVRNAKVYYASKNSLSFKNINKIMNNTNYDILYLNSVFTKNFSIYPLVINKLGLATKKPTVIAPRGELSVGALSLKSLKKNIFLTLSKKVRLFEDLIWQASNKEESENIQRELLLEKSSIFVVPNLTRNNDLNFNHEKKMINKLDKSLQIIFLSRISPKKNLDFLLKILGKINKSISLSIYGVIDDISYWKECNRIINILHSKIKVKYEGVIPYEKVSNTLFKSDLFILPTRGENFGHAIFESLQVGTPVLLSDQTPWRHNIQNGIQAISIKNEEQWIEAIEFWAQMPKSEMGKYRLAAYNYAKKYIVNSKSAEKTKKLFDYAFNQIEII